MHADGASILYLSYDGMTDQLGASQVLPYLIGLSARHHRITLISFEKPRRDASEITAVRTSCEAAGIEWHPLSYHKRPPILSSLYDLAAMRQLAKRLHRDKPFDLVHCRSYLPAIVGLALKRRLGLRFLFDMRGFWADERVEGGLWNLGNPMFRAIYRYVKRREVELLREADAIVSLTEAGKAVLLARPDRAADGPPITVIPCCVDFEAFHLTNEKVRAATRRELGIAPDTRVTAYLGSIGTWYMLDEMLDCFAVQLARDPTALFLFITRDDPATIRAAAAARGIREKSLMIRAASRSEVSRLLIAVDQGLFFIHPTFSKTASCPTKLGEFLAVGIPVITNSGVGDVDKQIMALSAGVVIERFDAAAYGEALARIDTIPPEPLRWREGARRWFDLHDGVARYDAIYRGVSEEKSSTSRGACDTSE